MSINQSIVGKTYYKSLNSTVSIEAIKGIRFHLLNLRIFVHFVHLLIISTTHVLFYVKNIIQVFTPK